MTRGGLPRTGQPVSTTRLYLQRGTLLCKALMTETWGSCQNSEATSS